MFGYATQTAIPDESAEVESVDPVFPSTNEGEVALLVFHEATVVHVLAPIAMVHPVGDKKRVPESTGINEKDAVTVQLLVIAFVVYEPAANEPPQVPPVEYIV